MYDLGRGVCGGSGRCEGQRCEGEEGEDGGVHFEVVVGLELEVVGDLFEM